jgi:endonuclease/exonuclease/phosphatase family metal-dependent hydrolase
MIPPTLRHQIGLALLAFLFSCLAHATPLRVATLNVELGLGAPGGAGHDAAKDILERIDADVVALQELRSPDLTGNPSALESLAAALGYPTIHVATTTNVLDTASRVGFLSRYPISSVTNIASPPGANDMVRQIPAIVVDLPGLNADPTILTLHLKCCLDIDDPFRRAVELHRVTSYLQSSGLTSADNVIVLGDFNLIGSDRVYNSRPAGLPVSYVLGNDVSFPVNYFMAPATYFNAWSLTALDARQLNGSNATSSSSVLDYILATSALTSRPHASEIYNSARDTANGQGLPKAGSPLPAGTSGNASDHLAVFADFELVVLSPLTLTISPGTVSESDSSGAAVLTITLPAAPGPGETVEVTLSSSDPSEAIPVQSMVTFSSGMTARTVDLIPQLDALLDGSQNVTFTASAPGFGPDDVNLTVTDTNTPFFTFSSVGQTIQEDFATFDGSADPARWPTSRGTWLGADDGSSGGSGNYSYGPDPSLGILLDSGPVSTTAEYLNETGGPITALQIAYDAEQWRSSQNGAADQILVELLIDGGSTPLPGLTFTANTSLPSGPIVGGASTALTTVVSALSIPPGDPFQLCFTATPGPGGGGSSPDDIFLNEFHYDNVGGDSNEFVEMVIGPGFSGPLSDISVVFYNGNGGGTYSTHVLDTFTLDVTTASGHRVYSKLIPGIQNGAPDGIAIVVSGVVLHFHSYEGVIVASNGPASGMSSTNIGVAQAGLTIPAPGVDSLGLTGSGGEAADFTWTRFSGPYTRGSGNDGQTFTAPAGSQGMALDNVAVTVLLDTDLDGDPDLFDPDDDNDGLLDTVEALLGTNPLLTDSDGNGTADGAEDADGDGQSNLAEVTLTLTDPLDGNSRFFITVAADPGNPDGAHLSMPTLTGRFYAIERSHDLLTWSPLSVIVGDDTTRLIPVAGDPLERANFFRVEVSLP